MSILVIEFKKIKTQVSSLEQNTAGKGSSEGCLVVGDFLTSSVAFKIIRVPYEILYS